MKYLITIVGPTAIGKTALAIRLAQHYKCEIISADSRQFYKEMCVGTAVPTKEELAMATHHFIHNKSIFDTYSVGEFEADAITKLEQLFTNNDFAVMVGGSGLYIDAVLHGLDSFPEVDLNTRDLVRAAYEKFGIIYLQEKLKQLDPDYYLVVDTGNPQRMMRAVEVSISSGKPYSVFLNKGKTKRKFNSIVIGLEADRVQMYDRINQRVDIMIAAGLVEEARLLYENRNLNALRTVGYTELFRYFNQEISLEFAISEIKKNTRRFAKRQMTWFRKKQDITWFDYQSDLSNIVNSIARQVTV